MYNDTNRKT